MTQALLADAIDHLMRYRLTGCPHSVRHAAHLVDQLTGQPDLDDDTRCLCGRMSEALEAVRDGAGGRLDV